MRIAMLALAMSVAAVGGCTQPALRPSFVNATPEERTMAVVEAVRTDDTSKVPQLITMLNSDDPAQRMMASDALERLTGQTMGYDFAASEIERSEAIARWKQWYLAGGVAGEGAGRDAGDGTGRGSDAGSSS